AHSPRLFKEEQKQARLESAAGLRQTCVMTFKRSFPGPKRVALAATLVGALSCLFSTQAQPNHRDAQRSFPVLPLEQSASRSITTRDPSSVVKCKDEYWVFYTGHGVPSYHSKDLVKWERGPAVFKMAPEWIAKVVPENRRMEYWAPDIIKVGDRYFLYYAVSSFGKMTSAIGLATNPTLDPQDPAYHWTDEGFVVRTQDGDGYNAIDPSVFRDQDGSLWMAFGSYWSGIKLVQLDPQTGKRIAPEAKLISLAYNDSIEASCLTRHGDYYYLFVNWGSCCQGPKSTYNIRIGRSKSISGPYVDKAGLEMLHRGGSVFLSTTNGPLIGPGHAGTLEAEGKQWLTSDFEGDLRMDGRATLAIMPLHWDSEGWPEATVNDLKNAPVAGSTTK
ncbi:MAG TPA: arabinan endo-1,5-alpha-L-arabinosidase, partial [Verrucomicrobiae bacterium]|nr:arabinan endo-1,5-alpha-L-arabinosidase [Verrucomicrobiae bacterium]